MAGDGTLDDQGLLARLGGVARAADGPPELAYDLGRGALAWRNVDSELAQLVADSALETSTVRSAGSDTRLLSFETGDMTIEVQVSVRQGQRSLLGQVIPEPAAEGGVARVETSAGPASSAPLDQVGRFEIDDVPGELLRIRIEAPGGAAVTTAWVGL
jgi:hypothetical protein